MNLKRIGIATILLVAIVAMVAMPAGASYNRYNAEKYAEKYAKNPNPAYRTFDLDCTNFVSQALLAGGWTEVGKYAYWSDDAWYYDGGSRPWYSNSWAVADSLYRFLDRHPGRATKLSVGHPYSTRFQAGDIIQIDYDRNGRWDHSMIVTGVRLGDADDLLMSYHTSNTLDKSLISIQQAYPNANFVGWSIK